MTPCYYCREYSDDSCRACIHGDKGPTVGDVHKGLGMLKEARELASKFSAYGVAVGVVAVHRNARDL